MQPSINIVLLYYLIHFDIFRRITNELFINNPTLSRIKLITQITIIDCL